MYDAGSRSPALRGCVPVARVDAGRLLGRHVERPRLMDLVNGQRAARAHRGHCAGAGRHRSEISYCGSLRSSVQVRATCPGLVKHASSSIWPPVSSRYTPAPEPNHGAHAEIAAQHLLDVGARQVGIAIRIEQALLGGQAGSLTVDVNGAALEHERRAIAIRSLRSPALSARPHRRDPREIQTAGEPAPGIEGPIDAAPPPRGVDHEGRSAVAHPGIVAGHFDDAHAGAAAARARSGIAPAETPTVTGSPAAIACGNRRQTPPAPAWRRRASCRAAPARASSIRNAARIRRASGSRLARVWMSVCAMRVSGRAC